MPNALAQQLRATGIFGMRRSLSAADCSAPSLSDLRYTGYCRYITYDVSISPFYVYPLSPAVPKISDLNHYTFPPTWLVGVADDIANVEHYRFQNFKAIVPIKQRDRQSAKKNPLTFVSLWRTVSSVRLGIGWSVVSPEARRGIRAEDTR